MSASSQWSLRRTLVVRVSLVLLVGLLIACAILYAEFRVGLMGIDGQSIAVQVQDLRSKLVVGASRPTIALSPAQREFYSMPGAIHGYQILGADGAVIESAGFHSPYFPTPVAQRGSDVIMQRARDPQADRELIAAAVMFDEGYGPHWLRVVLNLEDSETLVAKLMLAGLGELLPTLPFLFLPIIAVVIVTIHRSLRPLREVSRQAAALRADNLHARLHAPSLPAEIAPLVNAINSALERLEADYRAQRDFTAHAAHELRTPLATLHARLEARFSAEELGDVTADIDHLARLVDQLLCLARLDSGVAIESQSFDAYGLALDVARELAPRAEATDHRISATAAPAGVQVSGNPMLVRLVFRNLLENAVQHTPAGTSISIEAVDARTIAIADDGPGMDSSDSAVLFERFRRGSKAQGEGAGLGLAIAARVMERHGGRLTLEPTVRGLRFHLSFDARV